MSHTQQQVTQQVEKRVPTHVLCSIITYVIAQEPPLWGMRKGKHFYHHFVLVTLYKDCYAIGQDQLYNEVKKWILCSSRSLCHNIL
jgi:predicted GTPase